MICRVFVYGTLCRGGCRQSLWPVAPTRVLPAIARGRLFGHRDYPAMVAGVGKVAGECWQFAAADVAGVLAVLDEIEQTGQPGLPNLYDRVVVGLPKIGDAYAYHYATDPAADGFVEILPMPGGAAAWLTI